MGNIFLGLFLLLNLLQILLYNEILHFYSANKVQKGGTNYLPKWKRGHEHSCPPLISAPLYKERDHNDKGLDKTPFKRRGNLVRLTNWYDCIHQLAEKDLNMDFVQFANYFLKTLNNLC